MKTVILDKQDINELVLAFEDEKVVAMPTDTVFGMGCIYDSEKAIERIKKIKHRDALKPLPMMCNNLEMMEKYTILNDKHRHLIKTIEKGAITYVVKVKDLPSYINNGKDTIAIRIPDNDLILELIKKLDRPILMTSANMSNEANIKTFDEVYQKFNQKLDIIVRGDAKSEVASTIVDLTQEEIKILREGAITKAMIEEIMNQ